MFPCFEQNCLIISRCDLKLLSYAKPVSAKLKVKCNQKQETEKIETEEEKEEKEEEIKEEKEEEKEENEEEIKEEKEGKGDARIPPPLSK